MTGLVRWPVLMLLIAAFWGGVGIGYQFGTKAVLIDQLAAKKTYCVAPK
jgi:hypothetical protein